MQTGDFSFGVRIGVEDAKSLDLLHDFSLSVQTCLSFFCFCFFAFKLMHSAHGEMQWQKLAERKKKSRPAKLTTQSIVFIKGRINELLTLFIPNVSAKAILKNCLFAVPLSCIFWMGR